METEKIFIGVDDKRIELKGADLTAYKAQKKLDNAEAKAQEDKATARADARTSALAKLAKLGLTKAEIESL
jgi:hypothetical protein